MSILTELLRSDTRLLKVLMCISVGNDLVLQCAQAQAGTSHSGAGDARDLAQQIEAALDRRVITEDLQAVATRVLTEAFASDREDPLVEQLRSAVAAGCTEAAALEAAVHLERNARSVLQRLPSSKWKEALEKVFRAYPALLERPVKDTVAEVSPEVILALLRGGNRAGWIRMSTGVGSEGRRRETGTVFPGGSSRNSASPRGGADPPRTGGGSSPGGGRCSSGHSSDSPRRL